MISGVGEGIAAIAVLVVVMVTVNKMLGTTLGGVKLPNLPNVPGLPGAGPGVAPPFMGPQGAQPRGLCFLPGPGYNPLNQNEADCTKYGGHWLPLGQTPATSPECRNHEANGEPGVCDPFGHWHPLPF